MPYDQKTMSATKNAVESFRDVVQDLLVPELKAVKVSVDSLHSHSEMSYLRTEMKLRDEKMEQLVRTADEKNEQAIRTLSQKLDFAIDIRERLASLEARLPRQ
jgi:hypothetical protein